MQRSSELCHSNHLQRGSRDNIHDPDDRGSTTGCSGMVFGYPDTCNFLPDWPLGMGGTFTLPAAPGSYTDGNFGGVVKVLTPLSESPRVQPFDAIVTPINADNSYVVTANLAGSYFITNSTTGKDFLSDVPQVAAFSRSPDHRHLGLR